jgi:glycosyltransferase involved in cell wall biosynthesis
MHVLILGTRGVPAKHGGFETFAQDLSLYLTARNHKVTVYCQTESGSQAGEDVWNGVRRVLIPVGSNAVATVVFDWIATWRASFEKGVVLTLGYNTAIFSFLYRLRRIPNAMNMDGIEWKRQKWSPAQRVWLWLNERAGAMAAHHLIADHPEIARHLCELASPSKISMIPYGADAIVDAPVEPIERYGLSPKNYNIVIARPEPENSILEMVRAYSMERRGAPLVVLGRYSPETNPYQKSVMDAAGPEIKFLGAIYDREVVRALRFHAKAYFHGHTVGGTNPSLVESLAAGNAVIAHDNPYNRWVAGESARYFRGVEDLVSILAELEREPGKMIAMEEESRRRHRESFTQDKVLSAYEHLLLELAPVETPSRYAKPASVSQDQGDK